MSRCFLTKHPLISLTLVVCLAVSGLRAAPRLSAGCERDYPPFCDVDETGRAFGFSVDVLKAVLSAMNRDVEFTTGDWAEVKSKLAQGEVDILPLVGRTPEREALFDFTFPYLSSQGAIVVRSDGEDIETLEDLRGRNVAVMAQDNAEEFLRRETQSLQIHPRPGYPEALRELSSGEHDAVVMQRLVALHLVRDLALANLQVLENPIGGFRQDFCLAVRDGDAALLALLNEGLSRIMADGTFRKLHASWFSGLTAVRHRPIVIGGDHAYPPFEFLDENARPSGMNTEITRALARETGFEVVFRLGPWKEIVAALESGQIDVLQGMFFTPERNRTFDFSPPYLISEYIAVTRQGSGLQPGSLEDLRGMTVAVQAEDAAHYTLRASGIESVHLLLCESQENVLEMVADGLADCGVAARSSAMYLLRESGRKGVRLGTDSLMSLEYCYAVRKGERGLLGRITEGLALLDQQGELQDIRRQWLGVAESGPLGFFGIVRYFGLALAPLALLALIFMLWSGSLRRQVALKTVELRESEKYLRNVLDNLPLGIAVNRNDPRNVEFDYMNDRFPQIYRTTREALCVSGAFWEVVYEDPEFRERIRERVVDDCASGNPDRMQWEEIPLAREGEATSYISARNIPVPGAPYFISMVWDVTEHRQDSDRIQHLNGVLRTIRDVNQLIVRVHDPDSLIRQGCDILMENRVYASALLILTDEQDQPFSWAESGVQKDASLLETELAAGRLPRCCENMPSRDEILVVSAGAEVCGDCPLAQHCSPGSTSLCARLVHGSHTYGYLIVALTPGVEVMDAEKELFAEMAGDLAYALRNIRIDEQRRTAEGEQRSLTEQLSQAQKMEAVGSLAGSVAHDFNNLLMGIQGYAELCREGLEKNHPVQEFLEEIITGSRRSADLTRQLLAFARKQTVAPKVLDINTAVEGMLSLLRRLAGEHVTLDWHPGSQSGAVKIDPSQIDQIMANLCVNARDAILNRRGKVEISTQNVVVDKDFSASHPEATVGEFVMLAVSDNGCGMTPDVLEHIFDPFFSTKAKDKGTGLGLSTVYGITRQNGGFVTVQSLPEKGTTFRIYLPRCEETPSGKTEEPGDPVAPGQEETILVVDDERTLLGVIESYLSGLGYRVTTAESPREAIRWDETHAGGLDLLISDMVMPGMDGGELAERLLKHHSSLKCLFLSGYVADSIRDLETIDRKNIHFLQKPVAMQTLAVKVRDLLDGKIPD